MILFTAQAMVSAYNEGFGGGEHICICIYIYTYLFFFLVV